VLSFSFGFKNLAGFGDSHGAAMTGASTVRRTALGETSAKVPEGRRVYAIGDIHGRADLLNRLHAEIALHAREAGAAHNLILYVGDLVDRGPNSNLVVDMVMADPPPGFGKLCLMGNHEAMMLEFLGNIGIGMSWALNGGAATLASYGVEALAGDTEAEWRRAQRELVAAIPESQLVFLRRLPLYHQEGDYLFAHAGVRPGIALDRQAPDDLLWIREEFLDSDADHGKVVVHGHTVAREVEIRPNRIGIDTGAYASGRLTCLVLAGRTRNLLQT
jgi:serine/threonine protein phosphatase 1